MKPHFHSFSGRLTRSILLVMLVTMTIVSFLIFMFSAGGSLAMMKDHYQDILSITNEQLEGMLNLVETTSMNNVDEIHEHLDQPDNLYPVLANELKLNPHIVGMAVAFVPEHYQDKGYWFEPYAHRNADGTIYTRQLGSASHDYTQAEWYIQGIQTKAGGYWSEPYYDDTGAQEILCSYVLPVKDNQGKAIGVFCADISLTSLTERVKEFKLGAGISHLSFFSRNLLSKEELDAYCFILSRNGEFLVHPDPNRILHDNYFNHRNPKGSSSYEEIGIKMLAGENGNGVTRIDGVKSMVFYTPLKHTGWSAAVVVTLRSVILPGIMLGIFILLLQGLGLLIAAFFFRSSIKRDTQPLQYLVRSTNEVAKGHFDTQLPELRYHDEIHQLRDSFENMQKSLTTYVNELTEATSKQAAIESELHIASDIQNAMLPKTLPERVDMDIFASLTPAKTVGGDLYDFFIKDHQLFFCIGDVSGKGVPAAMVMAVTSTLFRTLAVKDDQPAAIMDTLNNSLAANNDSLMFVTLFFGILDQAGHLTYCNAGHDAPIVLGPDGKEEYLPVDSNVAAGVMPDFQFTQQEAQLSPGTTLFLFTDGLTEAENAQHELFGMDRTFEAAKAAMGSCPAEFVQKVTTSVHAFVNGADQSDDLTMMAIKYLGL